MKNLNTDREGAMMERKTYSFNYEGQIFTRKGDVGRYSHASIVHLRTPDGMEQHLTTFSIRYAGAHQAMVKLQNEYRGYGCEIIHTEVFEL